MKWAFGPDLSGGEEEACGGRTACGYNKTQGRRDGTLGCLLMPVCGAARGERWTRIVGTRCGELRGLFRGEGRAGRDRRAVSEERGAGGPGGGATRQPRQIG